MNIPNRRYSAALLLSSIIFLHGCTGSPQPDSKERLQVEAKTTTETESLHLANKTVWMPHLPAPAPNTHEKKAADFARPAAMGMMLQATSAGRSIQDTAMANDRRLPVYPQLQRESYNANTENPFMATNNDPLSTFAIDVDTASYANIRRWLTGGNLPPVGAVRIEEMINYFSYHYPEPDKGPIGLSVEVGPCPWQPDNKIARIGIKAQDLDPDNIPPSNLVFLIDVSGSMSEVNKLPLLQQSMLLLAGELTSQDRVSIVVYAGADQVILPPTSGDRQDEIKKAISTLSPGGSTHASSGIVTAYKLARQGFIKNGNNRIILASDGDFNVGVTSRGELERLISKERESGIFLTVLGFGMGNYHDDTMEILADKGNGNYSYIDSLLEAKKVLIKERTGTLFTLARDVKLQIEFNPSRVGGYRLIGYENRALADEDFNNDTKDAGEIGAGHRVTALYELLPVGAQAIPKVDPLKYQTPPQPGGNSAEMLNVKLRYKPLNSNKSVMLTQAATDNDIALASTSDDFQFAASVAGFGMLLRHSEHAGSLSYSQLITMARQSRGTDDDGYRAEFVRLIEMSELLGAK
jgi:Ca-activated chloride channel family protein